jgi:DNA (cytosine-5)-methyltransferase 1
VNYIDLFSGIGGFAYGAWLAGMKFDRHYYSEIDKYCVKLYKLRFPDSIYLGDITKIDWQEIKQDSEWILTGGFPCQDISIAGKGVGIHGKRSGLWFEMWRAISILRPRFAIMENVGAIAFRGLKEVLGSLHEIGYNAEWQDIRASDMGAPHKRERIWIVAYTTGSGNRRLKRECGYKNKQCNQKVRSKIWGIVDDNCKKDVSDSDQQHGNESRFHSSTISQFETSKISESKANELANTNKKRKSQPKGIKQNIRGWPINESEKICNSTGKRFQNRISEKMEGSKKGYTEVQSQRSNWWEIEPDVGRLVDGIPGRVDRLRGLGNSIIPQIAELLFRQIKELL